MLGRILGSIGFFVATVAVAQLRPAAPASVGMSATRLEGAAHILAREVDQGRVLAASILVARRERIVLHKGFGRLRPTPDSPPATPDTVYLLASITKPVTACAVMMLVERGQIGLRDPVSRYLPEFTGGDRGEVQIRDLLTHTSGLVSMPPENSELRRGQAPLSEFLKGTLRAPLLFKPRTAFRYQSMGLLFAAEILERITGVPLRDFQKKEIFDPLGMKDSSLGLGGRKIEETAWCEGQDNEDSRRFGSNSPYWRDIGHPWGGMHSSTRDLAILLQTFLNRGSYAGTRILSPATVEAMTRNQNPGLSPWGLGWAIAGSSVWAYHGELASPRTFGHSGASGTVAWADPERQLLCVILTTRPSAQDQGRLLRMVSNAVTAAVE